MYSSGSASSTDNQANVHSATSKNKIEEAEVAGNAAPATKDCLVLDEEMVESTIIKPQAAEFVPSSP
eukprot:3489211-Lingulodinium_polyedra.AAC.1